MNNEELKKYIEADKVTKETLGISEYQSMALFYLSNRYGMDIRSLVKQGVTEFIKCHCTEAELKQVNSILQSRFESHVIRGKQS